MRKRRTTSRLRVAIALAAGAWLAGCCSTPSVVAAAGKSGPYVRAAAAQTQARTGLALPPGTGWPPALATADGACTDEQAKLEADLGVVSRACPFQRSEVSVSGNADTPITPPAPGGDADQPVGTGAAVPAAAPIGFNLLCYDLGKTMLVVEYEQQSVKCSHVVGLALFHKQ